MPIVFKRLHDRLSVKNMTVARGGKSLNSDAKLGESQQAEPGKVDAILKSLPKLQLLQSPHGSHTGCGLNRKSEY